MVLDRGERSRSVGGDAAFHGEANRCDGRVSADGPFAVDFTAAHGRRRDSTSVGDSERS